MKNGMHLPENSFCFIYLLLSISFSASSGNFDTLILFTPMFFYLFFCILPFRMWWSSLWCYYRVVMCEYILNHQYIREKSQLCNVSYIFVFVGPFWVLHARQCWKDLHPSWICVYRETLARFPSQSIYLHCLAVNERTNTLNPLLWFVVTSVYECVCLTTDG